MSMSYRPLEKVPACDLFDGRVEEFGVREHVSRGTTESERCLTDGWNYLWVFIGDDGFVRNFKRWVPNGDPEKILNAVGETFETYLASECEPQYWGFDTHEEWEAAEKKMTEEYERKFYIELLKYCRGEPNDIELGTIGMLEAEIAKKLVEKDPSFLLPENKDKFRNEIKSIYDRDHAISFALSP